ncbi:MAG: T9SS type A sorting domain-containing protein, partial [Chitinophagaceae bacterium]
GNWYYFHFDFSQFKFDSSIVPNYYQQLYPAKAALIKGDEFYISSNSASNPNNILSYINYANNNFNNERLLFLRLYVSSSNPNANLYLKQLNIRGGFLTLLPVAFNAFNATKNNKNVHLNWSMKDETNIEKYIVEKSNASNVFETMKTVLSNKENSYTSIDNTPNKEVNMYRIKAIAKDGKATYSSVVKVLNDVKNETVTIYPNPVKDILSGQVETKKTEKTIIQIRDLQGRVLQQKEQQLQVGNNTFSMNISAFAKGIYILAIKGSVNKSMQLIKE